MRAESFVATHPIQLLRFGDFKRRAKNDVEGSRRNGSRFRRAPKASVAHMENAAERRQSGLRNVDARGSAKAVRLRRRGGVASVTVFKSNVATEALPKKKRQTVVVKTRGLAVRNVEKLFVETDRGVRVVGLHNLFRRRLLRRFGGRCWRRFVGERRSGNEKSGRRGGDCGGSGGVNEKATRHSDFSQFELNVEK